MTSTQLKHSAWFWFSILWASVIFILSVIPAVDLPTLHFWEPDKLAHAIVYATLTVAVAKTFFIKTAAKNFSITRSVITCIIYSFFLECIQRLLPSRTFDLYDVLANCIGTLLGVLLLAYVFRLK